jgi:hypothetical protein
MFKRTRMILALATLALCASAMTAYAGGLNFAWTNCYGEGSPVLNRNFACNTNTGTNIMVASFIPTMTSDTVNGNEIVIDIQSQGATLPAWWQSKNVGTCRSTSLSVSSTANATWTNCQDEFFGQATSGIGAYNIGFGGAPNSARLIIAEAVPASALTHVDPSGEYFAINVALNNAKTTGTGSCAGCTTPVCIVLTSIKITAGGGSLDEFISNAASNNYLTWQNITFGNCPARPTIAPTWGAIRSLMR